MRVLPRTACLWVPKPALKKKGLRLIAMDSSNSVERSETSPEEEGIKT